MPNSKETNFRLVDVLSKMADQSFKKNLSEIDYNYLSELRQYNLIEFFSYFEKQSDFNCISEMPGHRNNNRGGRRGKYSSRRGGKRHGRKNHRGRNRRPNYDNRNNRYNYNDRELHDGYRADRSRSRSSPERAVPPPVLAPQPALLIPSGPVADPTVPNALPLVGPQLPTTINSAGVSLPNRHVGSIPKIPIPQTSSDRERRLLNDVANVRKQLADQERVIQEQQNTIQFEQRKFKRLSDNFQSNQFSHGRVTHLFEKL